MIVFALLVACEPALPEFPVEQLLPSVAVSDPFTEGMGPDLDISAEGEGSWTVGDNQSSVVVTTPTGADLGRLDGSAAVLDVGANDSNGDLWWVAVDSRGIDGGDSVTYLYDAIGGGTLAEDYFGAGFARHGEPVGVATVDGMVAEVRPAIFATDEGDVELLPGEPGRVVMQGDVYRVVVLQSWTPEVDGSGEPKIAADCNVGSPLVFEMLVDPEYQGGESPVTTEVPPDSGNNCYEA